MAFDTKYRPRQYDDVLGQDASIKVLRQMLKEGKGFHQSYVFCGLFGSGKTTTGRILARALLCVAPVEGNPCDACSSCTTLLDGKNHDCLIELDAATKSTKEDMLRITEDIQYSSFSGKRRVYILDESHRLSKSALDALLKPMEDCITGSEDKQLVCIFCTTEPEKMHSTIFSRCAPAFVIKAATPEEIATRLAWVCTQEHIEYEFEALVAIAEVVDCHIRDALKMLESASVLGPVTMGQLASYLGFGLNDQILDLIAAIGEDLPTVVQLATALVAGASPTSIYERIAEAALCAYRVSMGVGKVPVYWSQSRIEALSAKGGHLLTLSGRFASPSKRPTAHTFILDAAAIHGVIRSGASPEAYQVSQAPVTYTPTPIIQVVPPSRTDSVVVGSITANAPKSTKPPVVNIDPRAVGLGSGSRRILSAAGEKEDSGSLDPSEFRKLFNLYSQRLKSNGTGSTR